MAAAEADVDRLTASLSSLEKQMAEMRERPVAGQLLSIARGAFKLLVDSGKMAATLGMPLPMEMQRVPLFWPAAEGAAAGPGALAAGVADWDDFKDEGLTQFAANLAAPARPQQPVAAPPAAAAPVAPSADPFGMPSTAPGHAAPAPAAAPANGFADFDPFGTAVPAPKPAPPPAAAAAGSFDPFGSIGTTAAAPSPAAFGDFAAFGTPPAPIAAPPAGGFDPFGSVSRPNAAPPAPAAGGKDRADGCTCMIPAERRPQASHSILAFSHSRGGRRVRLSRGQWAGPRGAPAPAAASSSAVPCSCTGGCSGADCSRRRLLGRLFGLSRLGTCTC